jgi:hypothetical protein
MTRGTKNTATYQTLGDAALRDALISRQAIEAQVIQSATCAMRAIIF